MSSVRAKPGLDPFPLTSPLRKFPEIIGRIELLRFTLGMNKSRFSNAIGMKPQTYNNFIGAQGSKPNVELLHGIVTRFGANPMWVLTGKGSMFLERVQTSTRSRASHRNGASPNPSSEARKLKDDEFAIELAAVRPIIERIETALGREDPSNDLLLDRLIFLFKQYLRVNPTESVAELSSVLERIEQRIGAS
jgi:hypothetical protein